MEVRREERAATASTSFKWVSSVRLLGSGATVAKAQKREQKVSDFHFFMISH